MGERLRKILKNLFCSLFIITMVCGDVKARQDAIDSDCTLAAIGIGYDYDVNPDFNNCETQSTEKLYDINGAIYRVISCESCYGGVTPTTVTKTYNHLDSTGGACQISYKTCGGCSGCNEPCIDDPKWQAYLNIYKKRVFRDCECNTCVESPLYLCATDYYDANNNGTSGVSNINLLNCKKCPTAADCTEDKWVTVSDRGVERCLFNYSGCTTIQLYRCKDGYYPETKQVATSLVCRKCPTMEDLENDTTAQWRLAEKTGYEIRSISNPAPKVCSEVAQYRCAAGYWGAAQTLSGTLSGCTRCATIMGVQSSSVAGENATRNKCCVKKGDRAKVTGGILEIDEPCCDDA